MPITAVIERPSFVHSPVTHRSHTSCGAPPRTGTVRTDPSPASYASIVPVGEITEPNDEPLTPTSAVAPVFKSLMMTVGFGVSVRYAIVRPSREADARLSYPRPVVKRCAAPSATPRSAALDDGTGIRQP